MIQLVNVLRLSMHTEGVAMYCVNMVTPINFIDDKCHIK